MALDTEVNPVAHPWTKSAHPVVLVGAPPNPSGSRTSKVGSRPDRTVSLAAFWPAVNPSVYQDAWLIGAPMVQNDSQKSFESLSRRAASMLASAPVGQA